VGILPSRDWRGIVVPPAVIREVVGVVVLGSTEADLCKTGTYT
jgi:hypothetical protein